MQPALSSLINLEPLAPVHYDGLHAAINPTLGTLQGWNVHRAKTTEELLSIIYTAHNRQGYYYTVFSQDDIIGFVGYKYRRDVNGYALATYLAEEARGLGINAASKDLIFQAFSLSNTPLYAFIQEDNIRSIKAMDHILAIKDEWTIKKYYDTSIQQTVRRYKFNPTSVSEVVWSHDDILQAAEALLRLSSER